MLPLHRAAARNHAAVVEILLGSGADPALPDSKGQTPLALAAQFGHEEALEVLLARGAEPTAVDARGQTALDLAARWGKDGAWRLLAKTWPHPADHQSCVCAAARWGHVNVLQALADAGADLEVGLAEAREWGRDEAVSYIEHWMSCR